MRSRSAGTSKDTCKSVDDDYGFNHNIGLGLLEGQTEHFLRDQVISCFVFYVVGYSGRLNSKHGAYHGCKKITC